MGRYLLNIFPSFGFLTDLQYVVQYGDITSDGIARIILLSNTQTYIPGSVFYACACHLIQNFVTLFVHAQLITVMSKHIGGVIVWNSCGWYFFRNTAVPF